MKNITETINKTFYGYDPDKFMPIYRDGALENRHEFIAYKTQQILSGLGHIAHKAADVTMNVIEHVVSAR